MGWVDKRPRDHFCDVPGTDRVFLPYGRGSVWACDECGKQWKWTGTEWSRVFLKRRLKEAKA